MLFRCDRALDHGDLNTRPFMEAWTRRCNTSLGYSVGLHSAGIYPRRLAAVFPLLDWVGMDVKAPFTDYERITGVAGSSPARKS